MDDAEAWAEGQLNLYDNTYEAVATLDTSNAMTILITVDMVDATVFGYFLGDSLFGTTMAARVVMRPEPT